MSSCARAGRSAREAVCGALRAAPPARGRYFLLRAASKAEKPRLRGGALFDALDKASVHGVLVEDPLALALAHAQPRSPARVRPDRRARGALARDGRGEERRAPHVYQGLERDAEAARARAEALERAVGRRV